MGGVPSVPRDPSRRVQAIVAGYSRTGTSSMQLALEKLLDGPVLHGGTQIIHREDAYCKKWVQAYAAKSQGNKPELLRLLREVTAGFVAVADMPPIDFIPELMELYPEAKVILTTRDPERWLKSVAPVAGNSGSVADLTYLLWPIPGWRWFPSLMEEFGKSAARILDLDDATREKNPAPSVDLLLNWNRIVKEMVPPEKLVVMQVQEGWEPICRFLDLPLPDEPLPHANETAASDKIAADVMRRVVEIWGSGLACVVAVAAFGAWRVWKAH
ncbi:P-loop containing nucleoside triphosphate hydrolase protein [Xylariaceae sp. FL0255]|nr:P-loop containing nucleoside triphosphate hydrolase protein [Xylariaceae sp. FL0255]